MWEEIETSEIYCQCWLYVCHCMES